MFDLVPSAWKGERVLVLGPGSAGLGRTLIDEHGVGQIDAVVSGAVGELQEMASVTYGGAVAAAALERLPADDAHKTLRWLRDHLAPGGECVVEVETFLAPDGGGLAPMVRTRHAQILFSREVLGQHIESHGLGTMPVRNPMSRSAYFMLFRRVGFEIVEAAFEEAEPDEAVAGLVGYAPSELRCSRFVARLRRVPEEPSFTELRATRIPR